MLEFDHDLLQDNIKYFSIEYFEHDIEIILAKLKKYDGDRLIFGIWDNPGGTFDKIIDLIKISDL